MIFLTMNYFNKPFDIKIFILICCVLYGQTNCLNALAYFEREKSQALVSLKKYMPPPLPSRGGGIYLK